jgi:hypothetical protein
MARHTISNLTINRPTEDNVGLFGVCSFTVLAKAPNIKSGTVSGTVTGQDNVGIMAGKILTTLYVVDAGLDLILDCSTTGTIQGRNNVGGMIGYIQGPAYAGHTTAPNIYSYAVLEECLARVAECNSTAAVTGSGQNIGGLVGYLNEIFVLQSRASGNVTGGNVVGGMIGYYYRGACRYCYATGNVTGTLVVGGLIGQARYRPRISKSYAEGNVTGTATLTDEPTNYLGIGYGGLVGDCDLEVIDRCYAVGNVTGPTRVGGLVGGCYGGKYASPNISDVFAAGDVYAANGTFGHAGGLIGYVFAPDAEFSRGFSYGAITSETETDAVIGEIGTSALNQVVGTPTIYENFYYNSDTNPSISTVNGGEGLSISDFQSADPFDDEWNNFDNTWVIDLDEADYPILKVFYDPLGIVVSAVKGTAAQGLICAYTVDGKTYYRKFDGTSWATAVEITELPAGTDTLSTFRTNDDRIGFIADVDGAMNLALTQADSMTIEHTKTLPAGTCGNLIQTDEDKPKLYYVNSIQALSKSEAVFTGDWAALAFTAVINLASDSYISRLRAKHFDEKTWIAWRSRGQHRIYPQSEAADVEESLKLVSGSIEIRQDTPVVSVSLEVDGFDRPEGEAGGGSEEVIGYQEVTPIPYIPVEYEQKIVVPETYVQKTEIPEGYTGIYAVDDLLAIQSDMAGKYIQMADIDLTGIGWSPLVGTSGEKFGGIYNANLYKITGLNGSPLFTDIDGAANYNAPGKVENLILDYCENAAICSANLGILKNCTVTGTSQLYFGGGGSVVSCIVNGETVGFVGGEGTEDDPFLVSSGADFEFVAWDMSAYYLQVAGIDMSDYGDLVPVDGPPQGMLQGDYNGNLYKITNLANPLFNGTHGPLSIPGTNGIVRNVIVESDNASICGYHMGTLRNCTVVGSNSRLVASYNQPGAIVKSFENGVQVGMEDGSGTDEDPFIVKTVEQLILIKNNMTAYYRQISDIDLSVYQDWQPIDGPPNGMLEGGYDGNGYKFTGVNNDGLFTGTYGLNSSTAIGEIKNVRVINANLGGKPAIVTSYNEGKITNCYVSGNACVAVGNYYGGEISYCTVDADIDCNENVGGICGGNYDSDSKIHHCIVNGNIEVRGTGNAGGICYSNDGNICDCITTCNITAERDAAGLIGQNYSSVPVKNCHTEGNILSTGYATSYGTTEGDAAGLIEYCAGEVENCHATGNVKGVGYVGGLFGYLGKSVSKSYATGDVEGGHDSGGFTGGMGGETTVVEECFASGNIIGDGKAGGFAGGCWDAKILNCFATGDVTTNSTSGSDCVGGFIGVGGGDWENCYSIGKVTGEIDDIGGFLGWNYIAWESGDYIINNCFYNSETSGQSDTGKGEPKATAELKNQSTFTDWDFDAIWKLSSITQGYPALQWQLGNDEYTPNYPPASKIRLYYKAGDSEPLPMGYFYIDRTQFEVGQPNVSVDARNSIGKYLKDQTFDERNVYSKQQVQTLLTQILTGAGITNYFVGPETTEVGIEFSPNQDVLSGINDVLTTVRDWMIREETADGKVIVAERTDEAFTQPGTYTFYRNRDVFSRSVAKDDNNTYGRVCVHTSDFSVRVYRSVSSNLGWLPPAQKTLYQQCPDGTTSAQAAALATEIAEQLSNSGEVEEFAGPIRPQLMPGDEAIIIDEDGPRLVGIITTVTHNFGLDGFYTQFTVDSGGKINKPLLSDYLKQISTGTIKATIIN